MVWPRQLDARDAADVSFADYAMDANENNAAMMFGDRTHNGWCSRRESQYRGLLNESTCAYSDFRRSIWALDPRPVIGDTSESQQRGVGTKWVTMELLQTRRSLLGS